MILGQVFNPKSISIDIESIDKDEVFEELVELFLRVQPDSDRGQLLEAIRGREQKMTTGIMHGVAVPHGRCSAVKGVHGVIGISRDGLEYNSLDNAPVHILFLILSSPNENELHLRVLKRLSQILADPALPAELLEQKNPEALYNVICRYEDALTAV